MPICPLGHKLRSRILGNLVETSLIPALLRGLGISCLALGCGIIKDSRFGPLGRPHVGLILMTGMALVMGTIALFDAWTWAGVNGPAQRLTSRAFGMAAGTLIPGIVALHALYFRWADLVQTTCTAALLHLFNVSQPILKATAGPHNGVL